MKTLNAPIYLIMPILTLVAFTATRAQIAPREVAAKIDSVFLGTASGPAPGSAVLVVKDGEVIVNKGFGLANLEHNIPITATTVFDLASVSKQFTGYAISLLIEQGKISGDDAVRQYVPEFPDFGHKVTVKHLVHHTSGLRDWTSTLPLAGWTFDDVISFDQILAMAYAQQTLNFTPGSTFIYSNTGYNVLAALVQNVSGSSFRQWSHKNIFQPLGMTSTFFLDDHTEIITGRASGYHQGAPNRYHVSPNNLTALGSSSLYSTTTDLARWVVHFMHPPDSVKPVVERMLQTEKLNGGGKNTYAYGLGVDTFRGTPWIAHSGSWASFSTYLAMVPAYDLAIVVLNNYQSDPSRAARQIASWYVPEPAADTKDPQVAVDEVVKLSGGLLNEYAGTYKLGPAWYVHLSREGDQLWTQATGEDKYPMVALSDTVFIIEDYGHRTMTFYRDEGGQVSHLVYSGMVCPKMAGSPTFSQEHIADYTGEYFSEELNTLYKVVLEHGQLKLWHFRHGDIPLTPAWGDDFMGAPWFVRSVEFQRDGDGKVTAFEVSQFRAKNQLFRKIDR